MRPVQLTELTPPPPPGARVFAMERRAGLADAAPGGRVRMDALARWLQDVAYEDVVDVGLAGVVLWVVRRNRIRVERFPRFGERVRLRTWASGAGRLWAERRTSVEGDRGAAVESVGLWVSIDPDSGRPIRLPGEVAEAYASATRGRVVKARLRHPSPGEAAERAPWRFRISDMDVAEHVNNAAYWAPLEERLAAVDGDVDSLDAEIEFRDPAQLGDALVLHEQGRLWITAPDGAVHASIVTS
jgi:acyl-ACP thioesterase